MDIDDCATRSATSSSSANISRGLLSYESAHSKDPSATRTSWTVTRIRSDKISMWPARTASTFCSRPTISELVLILQRSRSWPHNELSGASQLCNNGVGQSHPEVVVGGVGGQKSERQHCQ